MSLSVTCLQSVIGKILFDLGITPASVTEIVEGIGRVATSFENNKSTDSVSSILTEALLTIKNIVSDVADEVSRIFVIAVVLASVVIFITVIVVTFAVTAASGDIAVVIVALTVVVFIVCLVLISALLRLKVDTALKDSENSLLHVIKVTETRLKDYESEQAAALSSAFCAY